MGGGSKTESTTAWVIRLTCENACSETVYMTYPLSSENDLKCTVTLTEPRSITEARTSARRPYHHKTTDTVVPPFSRN